MAHKIKISDLAGEVVSILASSSGGSGYKHLRIVSILTDNGKLEETYFRIEGYSTEPFSYRTDTLEEAINIYNNDGKL